MRGRYPLIYGDRVGVEIPLEHDAVPLARLEGVGAVQHHVLHRPVLDDGRHLQPLQLDRAHSYREKVIYLIRVCQNKVALLDQRSGEDIFKNLNSNCSHLVEQESAALASI